MKTFMPNENDIKREWLIVDATDMPTGRLAVVIADALRGRDKPTYTPHIDIGAFVIVTNCEKIKLSGNKNLKPNIKYILTISILSAIESK